jgi:hypothetical protein
MLADSLAFSYIIGLGSAHPGPWLCILLDHIFLSILLKHALHAKSYYKTSSNLAEDM